MKRLPYPKWYSILHVMQVINISEVKRYKFCVVVKTTCSRDRCGNLIDVIVEKKSAQATGIGKTTTILNICFFYSTVY